MESVSGEQDEPLDGTFVCFDIETTGLSALRDRITEIGAVKVVNGETADFNVDSAYWSVLVNGEYGNYGISQQPVHDGDVFTIAYTK